MRSRYRISINNVQMDSLDSNLRILDISYGTLETNVDEEVTNALDGYDFKRKTFKRQKVTVSFELHIYDTAARNAACQKVNVWAESGSILRVNDRADQQLMNVRCETLASIGSVRDWTKPLQIVFTTTYVPYWQSRNLSMMLFYASKSVKGNLTVDGNTGEALISVEATAQEAITSFQITAGEKTLKLTGLSIPKNGKIMIDYVRNRYLRIRGTNAKGTLSSIMSKLDPSSDDNLTAVCGGKTLITIKASGKMSCAASARGLWI